MGEFIGSSQKLSWKRNFVGDQWRLSRKSAF